MLRIERPCLLFFVLSNPGYISGTLYLTSVRKHTQAEGYRIYCPSVQQKQQAQWSPTSKVVIDDTGKQGPYHHAHEKEKECLKCISQALEKPEWK